MIRTVAQIESHLAGARAKQREAEAVFQALSAPADAAGAALEAARKAFRRTRGEAHATVYAAANAAHVAALDAFYAAGAASRYADETVFRLEAVYDRQMARANDAYNAKQIEFAF